MRVRGLERACRKFQLCFPIICQAIKRVLDLKKAHDHPGKQIMPIEFMGGYLCFFYMEEGFRKPIMLASILLADLEISTPELETDKWREVSEFCGKSCAISGNIDHGNHGASLKLNDGITISFYGGAGFETHLLIILLCALEMGMLSVNRADETAKRHNCQLYFSLDWPVGSYGRHLSDLREKAGGIGDTSVGRSKEDRPIIF